ncbi:MAG: glycosyltransferase [Pseudonocardiales bacterium]|nr:glycosyltransferase [Pseudonocardiales bacterium]
MLSKLPKVSILMPIWRLQTMLFSQCIESVIGQDYPIKLLEICVCLDGTPSAEAEIVEVVLKKSGLQYEVTALQPCRGIAAARNSCAKSAHGEWFILLDHDDWLQPDAIRALVALATPDIDIVYSDYQQVDTVGRILFQSHAAPYHRLLNSKGLSWDGPLLHATFILQAILIRACTFRAINGFIESAGLAHEVDFRLRIFDGQNFAYAGLPLYCYVQRPNSTYYTRYEELVKDTCIIMLEHFRGFCPVAVTCRRLGKVAPCHVTHYGFYDGRGELLSPEWVDYRLMTLRLPGRLAGQPG